MKRTLALFAILISACGSDDGAENNANNVNNANNQNNELSQCELVSASDVQTLFVDIEDTDEDESDTRSVFLVDVPSHWTAVPDFPDDAYPAVKTGVPTDNPVVLFVQAQISQFDNPAAIPIDFDALENGGWIVEREFNFNGAMTKVLRTQLDPAEGAFKMQTALKQPDAELWHTVDIQLDYIGDDETNCETELTEVKDALVASIRENPDYVTP